MIEKNFHIGEVWVRPSAGTFYVDGAQQRIDRMAIKVLVHLAEREGQKVTREQLMDVVWEGRAVTPDVLTGAISRLRRVLGDSARDPRFIQTLPGVGYRLIASIRWDAAADVEAAKHVVEAGEGGGQAPVRTGLTARWSRRVAARWDRLGRPLQLAAASMFGVGAYLLVVCRLLA